MGQSLVRANPSPEQITVVQGQKNSPPESAAHDQAQATDTQQDLLEMHKTPNGWWENSDIGIKTVELAAGQVQFMGDMTEEGLGAAGVKDIATLKTMLLLFLLNADFITACGEITMEEVRSRMFARIKAGEL